MKLISIGLSTLVAGLIITGCGSSSNEDSTTGASTSVISGTVPGTLIEAFCTDGSYYQVNSNENNTSYHPFEIEIPNNLNCRLVMTTNENNETLKVVTPIGFVTADGNGTLFQAVEDIDLGHISLAMDRADINDTNSDGVSDDIYDLTIGSNELKHVEILNDPTDRDGDGLLNIYEDDDDDGISNHDDDDDDGDGISDVNDYDNDNDGVDDNDNDHDGIKNSDDVDDDNDGINDSIDSDDDGDGVEDVNDNDDDNDGVDDVEDADSDEYEGDSQEDNDNDNEEDDN